MDASSAEVRELLAALETRLRRRAGGHGVLTGQELAMALHGIRLMGSDAKQVRRIQGILASLLASSGATGSLCTMTGSEFATCLHALGSTSALPATSSFSSRSSTRKTSRSSASALNVSSSSPSLSQTSPLTVHPELAGLLNGLATQLENRSVTSGQTLTIQQVGVALYGLQGLTSECGGIEADCGALLSSDVNNKTTTISSETASETTVAAGGAAKTANLSATERILHALTSDVASQIGSPVDSQTLASALYGLQCMNADSSTTVCRCLLAFARALDGSSTRINAQAVGNALYGLQSSTSESIEVQALLRALASKIATMPSVGDEDFDAEEYELTGQNIGNALWGMRGMSPKNSDVRAMLKILALKIGQSTKMLNGQNIGNALYGLNGMTSDYAEVRAILRPLAFKVVKSTAPLTGLDIGMALYGLRGCDSSLPEVQIILGALLQRVKMDTSLEMDLSSLSMSMTGMISAAPWIRDGFFNILSEREEARVRRSKVRSSATSDKKSNDSKRSSGDDDVTPKRTMKSLSQESILTESREVA